MGLIHLYSATSTTFDNNGTPLVTAREAVVKRDEGFQLTFNIPISQNELHKRVQKEMIVSAMTPDGVNYFRIWDIEKRTTDVKVTALQLLYSLDVKQINPFGGKQYTGTTILQAFVNSFKSSISPYTFSSSIMTSKDFYTNEEDDTSTSHNALAILNKITDNWSGELMLNGFDVRMISKLGTKTDALLYEHKNVASFSDSSSMNGIVTRIYATATYTPERAEGAEEDPEPVVISATVDSPLINQYAVIYEATAEYNDARTEAELRTEILKQYSEFNVDKPERTIDVDTNIVDGTAINFGDELVLKYLVHDVDEVIRCVGYEYDPISENYIGVTLGTLEKTFLTKVSEGISSAVTKQFDKLNKQIQIVQTAANGKNRVTYGPNPVPNPIEGDLWFKHPEGRPDEIELLIYQNGLWLPAPFLTDQDKLAFEQEMSDHYDAALAEIERKDAEYKEVFDAYDEKVVTIDQDISDAATKAQSALEEAGISTDLAQTAKDLADTAKTDASTAISNASQAKEDALKAVTDASQAKEDAQSAVTEAGQAVASANTAKTNAQTALTDAQTALTTAENADTKSGLAEAAANTAKTNAQTALDNSNTAITNAADAITKAGLAETAANTAKTNAQTALDDAQSALTTAGSADSKAGQAIAKANAIPTTITDIIAGKNLVNGTYVDTKVNAATGAWSQELVRVEGKLDGLDIGGRNYFVDRLMLDVDNYERIGSYYYYTINNLSPEEVYTVSVRENYTNDISIGSGPNRALRINNDKTDSLGVDIIDVRLSNGIRTYEREIRANEDGQLFIISYIPSLLDEIHNMIKIEKGNIATDWTPAPEDLYSQEEFKIFNAQYTQDVTGITGRLTTVETDKLDGSTFQTFKQAEYQVTADKVASTITRVDTAEGKITTQGTAISQQATAIASKADKTVVDTLAGTVSTQGTSISQNATDISSKADSELVDDIKGTVDTHTTEISQNATDIASKASSTSVNALTGRVSTAETTISQHATAITSKASQTEVDTVKGTVSSHTTTLGQHATAISSKAESSLVDTIKDTVDTHTTDISQNATDIASKASSTSVNAVTGRVSTAESNISQNATAITQRVTTATYNTGIASKENTVLKQSTAPAHVNGRLWLDTSVTPNILKRSTGTAWVKATPTTPGEVGAYSQSAGAGLAGRLTTAETNITQTSTAITSKADKSTVDTLAGTVSTQGTTIAQHATAIESKADQTEVDTVKGTVSGHTTTISQHATAIASKAESSLVNTIKGTVDTHTTEISQNATDIASKASSSSVSTLTGRVNTAESNISQNATAISQRVTTTTYNTGLGTKENSVLKQSTAPSHLNGRLWLDTSVTPNILKRSTGTSWVKATPTTASEVGAYSSGQGSALAGRVTTAETNITQTATAIESKADQTEVDTVKGTVSGHTTTLSQHATQIASKAESSLVNTIKGTVDTHTTEISQNATAIASKASSTSVNTLTGRVSTAETTIGQHATAITSKASQSEVDTVKGTVSSHTTTLGQHATQISARLTSTQVNSLVDGKGFSTVNYVDSQITATAQSIGVDMTRVEGKIDGLEIGGRNLLLESNPNVTTSAYPTATFNLSEKPIDGETYTLTMKGSLGSGKTNFSIYNSGGSVSLGPLMSMGNGLFQSTFIWRNTNGGAVADDTDVRVYPLPNSTVVNSTIQWIKLEKGNKATDWTPAPEDTMMESDFTVFKGEYEATADNLSSRLTAIDKVGGRLSTAETKINQNATAISARLTTSQVNSLVDGKGLAQVTYVDNQINSTADSFGIDMTRVEGKIDGLEVGGRNLAINSTNNGQGWSSTVYSVIPSMELSEDWVVGETYTISIKGTVNAPNIFGIWRDTGAVKLGNLARYNPRTGVHTQTFSNIGDTTQPVKNRLSVFNVQSASATNASIEWIKVEKGTKATDWTPAPVDVEGMIPTEISNANLLDNSDFSRGFEGWNYSGAELSNLTVFPPVNGGHNVQIKGALGATRYVRKTYTLPQGHKGGKYVVKVRSNSQGVYGRGPTAFMGLMVIARNPYTEYKSEEPPISTKWETLSVHFEIDEDIIEIDVLGYVRDIDATARFDQFQLNKSDVEVGWSLSQSDLLTQSDFTVFKNTYESTVAGINLELSKTAKTADLNGMVTESVLATKQFVTQGSINTTLSNYLKTTDLNSKVQETVAYQNIKATTDRYTRVIGSTDAESRTNIAQIAMTDSLFQTTIRDGTGLNILQDTQYFGPGWEHTAGTGGGASTRVVSSRSMPTDIDGLTLGMTFPNATSAYIRLTYKVTEEGYYTFSGYLDRMTYSNLTYNFYHGSSTNLGSATTNTSKHVYFSFTFLKEPGRSDIYVKGAYNGGQEVFLALPKLEKGQIATPWQPSHADKANQSQVTQLAGSWALTLKSGNDIKTQINASTNSIRLASKFIHLSGTSLIDDAVIKSAMVDTLNVSKLTGTTAEFTTLRGKVITAGSISADRLVTGTALVDRVFIDTAAISQLTSKTAFINNIKAISIDVGKITGNTANFISAGFTSLNSQATINGNAIRIQNTAGEFVEMNNTPELRSDDAGGTAVVLGKGRVHFYDSRGYSKGYVGTDMHTAGSYDFGTFLSKGSGIYKFARMADATQTTYAYYTVKAGLTAPASVITNMVQNGYLPDGNPQQFVAKGNMLSQLNGWPAYPNWPALSAGQQIRYKELTSQTTGDAYEDIWKFGPSSQGDWRIYFAKHATFEGGTTGTSDRRLKHDIEPTQIEALGHIESLAFKGFRWNRDNKYEPIGLIAQDSGLIRVSDDDMEGIDIQRAIMLGLKGVQELQEMVKEQAAKIKQLEEINNQ